MLILDGRGNGGMTASPASYLRFYRPLEVALMSYPCYVVFPQCQIPSRCSDSIAELYFCSKTTPSSPHHFSHQAPLPSSSLKHWPFEKLNLKFQFATLKLTKGIVLRNWETKIVNLQSAIFYPQSAKVYLRLTIWLLHPFIQKLQAAFSWKCHLPSWTLIFSQSLLLANRCPLCFLTPSVRSTLLPEEVFLF